MYMFLELNKITKKRMSLFIILVIFVSCISVVAFDLDKNLNTINLSETLSNTDIVEVSYEVLAFQDVISQNRYKNFGVYINDKAAMLLSFFSTDGIDKSIYNTILRNISEIYFVHYTILIYIHKKDGKKQLI